MCPAMPGTGDTAVSKTGPPPLMELSRLGKRDYALMIELWAQPRLPCSMAQGDLALSGNSGKEPQTEGH